MRVLIAYDGSDEAKKAITALASSDLPQQAVALLLVPVQVWPPLPASCFSAEAAPIGRLLTKARRLAELAMREALATAREGTERLERLRPEWSIRHGVSIRPMPEGLLRRAEEWRAHYLVLGGRNIRREIRVPPTWCDTGDVGYAGVLLGRVRMAQR